MPKDKLVSLSDGSAFDELFKQTLTSDVPIPIGTFDNFVQDIFSQSFPKYNFNTWHIRMIANKIDKILANPNSEKKLLGVLPRYHLKSTILGYAATIYRMLTAESAGYDEGMYISYKDESAIYHSRHIKIAIEKNPILSPFMKDTHPQSDFNLGYQIGNRKIQIYTSGLSSFIRGKHTDIIMVLDDILGDLNNPLVLNELKRAEDIFNADIQQIPNKDCLFIVVGTVIDYSDLLFKLKNNPSWETIWMPAINPDNEHGVLWEARFPLDELEKRKDPVIGIGWKAFSSEFLLTPVLSTHAFFTREDLDPVISKLPNLSIGRVYTKKLNENVVAGFDIGKVRNPSHLVVFVGDETDHLTMIHQSFWDNIGYNEQAERLKVAIENFGIDKMYIDNSRSEMDERGLPRECIPIKFTGAGQRNQMSFASDFARWVEAKRVSLMDDYRYISQILCLSNDLKAPETAEGHADSFWSTALAIGCWKDYYSRNARIGTKTLGNFQEIIGKEGIEHKVNTSLKPKVKKGKCPFCESTDVEDLENGMQRCRNCNSTY